MLISAQKTTRNDNAPSQGCAIGKTNSFQQVQLCYPDQTTVKGRVLVSLPHGVRLTSNDGLTKFSSSRLAHHIYILRGLGWAVETVDRIVSTRDAGRPATIGVYFLSDDAIAVAGERGQKYAAKCARINVERRAV